MKKNRIWIDGRLREAKDAGISVFDHGVLYGDGLFETMRGYAGVVFKIDKHLDRLFGSLKILKINSPYSKKELESAVYRTVKANDLKSAYIRLTVTRGWARPTVFIIVREFEGYPASIYRNGITVKIAAARLNEYSMLAGMKSLNFMNYMLAKEEARRAGCDDAILLNTNGDAAEGATSNIFMVKRNELVTPELSCGILPGIARSVIIEITGRMKIKVREKRVSPRELLSANEVFLTNSLAEVLPVVRIDSKRIGSGKPGELTRLLHISYQKEVVREVLR